MGLFGTIEEWQEPTSKIKPPLPIPIAERDQERQRLTNIGIGWSDAARLVEADWTLEQLICQAELQRMMVESAECGTLPKFVKDVVPLVAAYCESRWTKKGSDHGVTQAEPTARMADGANRRGRQRTAFA